MSTSKYITRLNNVATGDPITSGTVELLPYGNSYPTGALALTHDHDGIWYRAAVPDGEYSLYYETDLVTSYQRFWVGENKLSLVADNFNADGTPTLDYKPGKNKFNLATAIEDFRINTSTGAIDAFADSDISAFIPVKPGEIYVLSGLREQDYSTNKHINWVGLYDENQSPITPFCVTSEEHTAITIPAGCYYIAIQLSYDTASVDYSLCQFEYGNIVTEFESYALEGFSSGFIGDINKVNYTNLPSKNLITSQGFSYRYIHTSTGAFVAGDANTLISSYIEVTPNKIYTFRGKITNLPDPGQNFWGAFYDEDFVYVDKMLMGLDAYSQKISPAGFEDYYTYNFIPPLTAKYVIIQVCYNGTATDLSTLQLEAGSLPTIYEAYGSARTLVSANDSSLPSSINSQWYGKKAVFLGDSISYFNRWQPLLVNALGINYSVTELQTGTGGFDATALGGSTITPIVVTDHDGQHAGESIYKRCDDVDNYSPDLIFLFGGQNDVGHYQHDPAIQTIGDATDLPYEGDEVLFEGDTITVPTFCSSYKGVLLKLLTQNPNVKIFCVTPYQCDSGIARETGAITNKELYVSAIIDIAKQYSCQLIDLCHESGITVENNAIMTYDGTHPSFAGAERIAQLIISKI